MRGYSHGRTDRSHWLSGSLFLAILITSALPLCATRGVFQGLVVEGSKREAGKYIYVAGPSGYMRRVNIQRCRVRFDSAIPPSQRMQTAAESLHDSAEIRVTADQRTNGEWIAVEIVILKVAEVDKVRLRI